MADKVTMDGSVEGCLSTQYNVEFIFDSDVKCAIRIHYFCAEEIVNGQVMCVSFLTSIRLLFALMPP